MACQSVIQSVSVSRTYKKSPPTQPLTDPQNRIGGVELEVSMLTMGYWPTTSAPPCTLPAEIQACCARFEAFYLQKHTGAPMAWWGVVCFGGWGTIESHTPHTQTHAHEPD